MSQLAEPSSTPSATSPAGADQLPCAGEQPPAQGLALGTGQVQASLDAGLAALLGKQNPDGHWRAELEGDSILSSEFILMKAALGQLDEPSKGGSATPQDRALFAKLANHLRLTQRPDGTWGQYHDSLPDISSTVKGYFALKLVGDPQDHINAPHMVRAKEAVHELGGAESINTFSTFYLACLGQVSWDACPAIPPELVLLPRWFPFHLEKCANWTRTLIVPLAMCSALRPVRNVGSARGIGELFLSHNAKDILAARRNSSADVGTWEHTFLMIDRALKAAGKIDRKLKGTPVRTHAINECRRWIDDRSNPKHADGLGAIFPPLVYIQIAYQAMGIGRDNPTVQQCEREIARWVVESDDMPGESALLEDQSHARIQPCFSPVWDTGIALYACTEAGKAAGNDERIAQTCDWLRSKEVLVKSDWLHNLRKQDRDLTLGPGGTSACWAFEYVNDFCPDVDDTAMIAKALWRAGDRTGESVNRDAARRATDWILRMQNDDGGWAAFDRTTHRDWMEAIPFADHNAMQDPSCADITGRTIESLVTCGIAHNHPCISKAIDYLRNEQHACGGWYGRWGVNYIYGTWQATGGLLYAREDMSQPYIKRTVDWLKSIQQKSGAFGESANSYLDDKWIGKGDATASQTAWAALALMHLVGAQDTSVERAIKWLCDTQLTEPTKAHFPDNPIAEPAGSWQEQPYTGGGFPKVFYLRYHLYRHYFPVLALARYRNLGGK